MSLHEKIVRGGIWVGIALAFMVPLYVNSNFFFPYIFSKALLFRVVTSIIFVLFLYLVAVLKKATIKLDLVTIVFAAYLVVMYLSSALGVNFEFSFWSSIERSEGLLFWTHLFIFYVVLRNFVDTKAQWRWAMDLFFGAAQVVAIIGLLQFLQVDFINVSAGGSRVASTIGNAAFLAGYMLFSVFIGLYLAFVRDKKMQLYYFIAAAIDVFIMAQTETRGAFIAFIISFVLFVVYNIFKSSSKKLKQGLGIAGVIVVLIIGGLYASKDADFVQNNNVLLRLTSISLSERTAQTRLMTWNEAWQGFLSRPILGYGQEHFSVVFNKYFNPEFFEDEGSRIWFDRAHNIFLDHLVMGGIVGFLLYIAILLTPIREYIRMNILRQAESVSTRKRLASQMIVLAIVSFIIQGLFVFETIPTYLGLFLVTAFIMQQYKPGKREVPYAGALVLFIIAVIAIGPVMYRVNIVEAKASTLTTEGLRLQSLNPLGAVNAFTDAIALNTAGTQEYRERLAEHVASMVISGSATPEVLLSLSKEVDVELQKQVDTFPEDVANVLLFMRHMNHTHVLDYERLYRVFELGDIALEYSPTRPNIYFEIGYAHFYLAEHFKEVGDEEQRDEEIEQMIEYFDKAIELNDDVLESYVNMVMVLLASERGDRVQEYFNRMEQHGVDYRNFDALNRMANSAVSGKQFDWAARLYSDLAEADPNNPQFLISLALSYANIGEIDEAVSVAERVKEFGPPYVAEAESFIEKLKSGEFILQ